MYDTVLVLADGKCFPGEGFGARAPSVQELAALDFDAAPMGEVVFNTTMGAYHEIITDPSYAGQMVVMTSVHIGNYGMDESWNEMFSSKPFCRALVVRDAYHGPVPQKRTSLESEFRRWGLHGITEVDTRALTIHLRESGSQYGVIVSSSDLSESQLQRVTAWLDACPPMEQRDFIASVTTDDVAVHDPSGPVSRRYALLDFGVKRSIVAQLLERNVSVTLFPAKTDACAFLDSPHRFDAVFLSNGPGDPSSLDAAVRLVGKLLGRLPVLGICLGHQLAALALGARTEKMKFGHHGGNHPVRDLQSGRVFVTAQNHGYCVDADSLPATSEVWLVNDNDGTVEGFRDAHHGIMAVQFHPEAAPGPREARSLFDAFIAFADTADAAGCK